MKIGNSSNAQRAVSKRPGGEIPEAITLIESNGWYLDRARGSRRQFKHPSKRGLVTIAGKPRLWLRH